MVRERLEPDFLLVGHVDPTLLAVRYSVGDCTSLTKELLGVGS